MARHPHLEKLAEIIKQFKEGSASFEQLQLNLSSLRTALEGDMPNASHIRKALRETENRIELAWFSLPERRKTEVIRLLNALENTVDGV